MLFALGMSMLSGDPTTRLRVPAAGRGPFGIMASLPTRNTLTLVPSADPATFAKLVLRLVNIHDLETDTVSGVAGLRLAFTHSNTILMDTIHGGRITVTGASKIEWCTVIARELVTLGASSRAVTRPDDHVPTACYNSVLLNPDVAQDQVTGRLLSAVLRRARLFHTTGTLNFLDLWNNSTTDRTAIEVEWSGDLPHGLVIDRLTDPLLGLPLRVDCVERFVCVCDPCLYQGYEVPVRHTDPTINAVIHLRRSDLYDAEPSPDKVCATRGRGPLVYDRIRTWQ
ncbi:hypothetical protein [Alloactinosynnema sp. L-07]|uniref:hypothetical protein n=1 Tax=Alloactinosynnema sp. L-07 TaxID=1653480 RepID=UPI0012FAF572|nr:hypothetical protein [Alloactinosynnema sp. L-07]